MSSAISSSKRPLAVPTISAFAVSIALPPPTATRPRSQHGQARSARTSPPGTLTSGLGSTRIFHPASAAPSDRRQARRRGRGSGASGKGDEHARRPASAAGSSSIEPAPKRIGDRVVVAMRHRALSLDAVALRPLAAGCGARRCIDQILLFAVECIQKSYAALTWRDPRCADPAALLLRRRPRRRLHRRSPAAAHQPADGHHAGALPRGDLRSELFYRRGHKVALTPLGEQLYELALTHLRARERDGAPAARLGRVANRAPARRRRRAVPRDRDAGALQPALSRACRSRCASATLSDVLESLLDYHTDVAVLAQFTDDPRFHSCRTAATRSWSSCIAHTASRGRKSIRFAELDGEGMILREDGFDDAQGLRRCAAQGRRQAARRHGDRQPRGDPRGGDQGRGHRRRVRDRVHPRPALRMVTVSNAQMYTHAHVVCLEERREARLVKAFLEIVAELQRHRGLRARRTQRRASTA